MLEKRKPAKLKLAANRREARSNTNCFRKSHVLCGFVLCSPYTRPVPDRNVEAALSPQYPASLLVSLTNNFLADEELLRFHVTAISSWNMFVQLLPVENCG